MSNCDMFKSTFCHILSGCSRTLNMLSITKRGNLIFLPLDCENIYLLLGFCGARGKFQFCRKYLETLSSYEGERMERRLLIEPKYESLRKDF